MKIICLKCGEPWDVDDVDEMFKSISPLIVVECPCCIGKLISDFDEEHIEKMQLASATASEYGDDLEGYNNYLSKEGLLDE